MVCAKYILDFDYDTVYPDMWYAYYSVFRQCMTKCKVVSWKEKNVPKTKEMVIFLIFDRNLT